MMAVYVGTFLLAGMGAVDVAERWRDTSKRSSAQSPSCTTGASSGTNLRRSRQLHDHGCSNGIMLDFQSIKNLTIWKSNRFWNAETIIWCCLLTGSKILFTPIHFTVGNFFIFFKTDATHMIEK